MDRGQLLERYRRVRARTEALAAWLSDEDQQLQAFPDASPVKWHRGHTTWFFETFALAGEPPFAPFDSRFGFLFNSYYDAVGARHPRPERGLLSRPSAKEVGAWRRAVDERVERALETASDARLRELAPVVELGTHHEEQHQELMLTDILAAFAKNALGPAVRPAPTPAHARPRERTEAVRFTAYDGGVVEIGHAGSGFAFDNEGPRHRVFLAPHALADRLVTVGEVKAFVDAGGYGTPSLWLSAGFHWATANHVAAPAYVDASDGVWRGFSVDGWRVLDDDEPAAFLSFYEADAIARFLGGRLPTEAEWEHAARRAHGDAPFVDGNLFVDGKSALRPLPARTPAQGSAQLAGDVWEWTRSAYEPYPGFVPAAGALGEYNGKFMIGQQVLRGGSAFTPVGHARASYRNFWPPETRFQLTGLRLARDP